MWGQKTGMFIRDQIFDKSLIAPIPWDDSQRHVPVLCYHYVRGKTGPVRFLKVLGYVVLSMPLLDDSELWTQSKSALAKQLKYLHDNDYHAVTLDEMSAWQRGEIGLPNRSVAITFDDGDRSVYEHAMPLLKRYNFRATFFVVTEQVGQEWEGVDGLDWDELREMQDSGIFQIESHTNNMHYRVEDGGAHTPVFLAADKENGLGPEWRERVLTDLRLSRQALIVQLGHSPRYLAWPFGEGNEDVDEIARAAGFERTCAMAGRTNRQWDADNSPSWNEAEIRRYAITARTSMTTFEKIVRGEFDDVHEHTRRMSTVTGR